MIIFNNDDNVRCDVVVFFCIFVFLFFIFFLFCFILFVLFCLFGFGLVQGEGGGGGWNRSEGCETYDLFKSLCNLEYCCVNMLFRGIRESFDIVRFLKSNL